MRRPGLEDQPPGGDLLPVLLPKPGTRGVQGGGLVDQLPGLIQVAAPVGLVGSYSGAVGVHATAVARTCGWADGMLGLCGGVLIVTVKRRACSCCGWTASAFVRAAATAGFLPGGSGTTRILLCHAVQRFVDLTDPFPRGGELLGVREGLADAAARVGDLTASVIDVGQRIGLACLHLGKTVF